MQKINGRFTAVTIINASDEAIIGFASRFSKKALHPEFSVGYAQACISEFLNYHNGLYAVNFSNEEGEELELEPPVPYEDFNLEYMNNIYIVPICFPFGTLDYIISF